MENDSLWFEPLSGIMIMMMMVIDGDEEPKISANVH
jgi:hypothetical protein